MQNPYLPTETQGLTDARAPDSFELDDGAEFELRIAPVRKRLANATVRMLAYGGSIPGPTLHVRQGTELVVHVVNEGDLETTVHWHGLRLENRFDGTTAVQRPVPVGGHFTYRLRFPDPGVYWYHPHIREDYGQEMGLYGNIVVLPSDSAYWPPVNRELVVTLDDVLLEDGRMAPFRRTEVTHAAMGRYGNLLLVNGEPELSVSARSGEVLRLYLTNTANSRVFDLRLPGGRMKLIGADSGHYEREELVDSVRIAPSERAVVDVLCEGPRLLRLEHHTPRRRQPLVTIGVAEEPAEPSLGTQFAVLRSNADMVGERESIARYLDADPNKTLAIVAEMNMEQAVPPPGSLLVYVCPMHPEVSSDAPGRCPECGMKLVAQQAPPPVYVCPMHPEVSSDTPGRCPECGMKLVPSQVAHRSGHTEHQAHSHADRVHAHDTAGIEWEDDMAETNRLTTSANTRWKLIDRATGAEGHAIDWRFRVGDRVKIRLVNEMDSDHPMHHPFHVHGAGRFLVLARDGVVEPNLVWKDTVLIPTGQTVDILLDVTNPGLWMAHCHIAEHHESGMMLSFRVDP